MNTNPRTIPQIVIDAVARECPWPRDLTQIQNQTTMVSFGRTTMYYIVDNTRTRIVNVQID
jgi:hypothetical protein